MDSMRSLNTSLPSSRPPPPEQLLQAFRTAALSVTNLYKSAVTDQSHSRQEGYQDALDDLLVFLDKENIGLQDGEGWRIRQWVTERYDRASTGAQQNDSDDEHSEAERGPRSVSPNVTQPVEETPQPQQPQAEVAISPESTSTNNENTSQPADRPPIFRFTAGTPGQHEPMQVEDSSSPVQGESEESATHAPVRVEVVPRGSRATLRHGSPRHGARGSTREFTFGAGTKRKLQFPDFFDISNVGSSRDGGGGGKRGRFA